MPNKYRQENRSTARILRKLRHANRINQSEVATAIGISHSQYVQIEKGVDIKIPRAVALANAWGITIDELTGRKEIHCWFKKFYSLRYIKEFCLEGMKE